MDTTGTILLPGQKLADLGVPKAGGQDPVPNREKILYLHLTSREHREGHHPGAVVHCFITSIQWFTGDGDPYYWADGFAITEGCKDSTGGTVCPVCPGTTCCVGWVTFDEPELFEYGSNSSVDEDWKPVTFAKLCASGGLDPDDYK